jgi:hypothetical protein
LHEEAEALKVIGLNEARIKRSSQDKREMAESRKADTDLKITDTNRKINK